jgi:hypothetical protein
MYELRIEDMPSALNHEALTVALNSALPGVADGFATDGRGLRVIFRREPTAGEQATARAIVTAHDPDALTPEQQQRVDREAACAVLQAQVEAMDLTQPLGAEDADIVARYNALRGLLGK